ncbi:unnamed protein product [Symbiodinium sp. CCMP2456]|nr:unnamed protein product [Symbiodinium sp. CCMP2456]
MDAMIGVGAALAILESCTDAELAPALLHRPALTARLRNLVGSAPPSQPAQAPLAPPQYAPQPQASQSSCAGVDPAQHGHSTATPMMAVPAFGGGGTVYVHTVPQWSVPPAPQPEFEGPPAPHLWEAPAPQAQRKDAWENYAPHRPDAWEEHWSKPTHGQRWADQDDDDWKWEPPRRKGSRGKANYADYDAWRAAQQGADAWDAGASWDKGGKPGPVKWSVRNRPLFMNSKGHLACA